jgi:polyisoprenoid-binding protein YceI
MKIHATVIALLIGAVCTTAQTEWTVDKNHTDIRFTATHMTISEVDGEFREFDGKVTNSGEDFAGSKVVFTANVTSLDTDNERRDNHLKSDDFFNAEEYPELKFEGTLEKEDDTYFLVGDLTIRDVTKAVKFPAKFFGQIEGGRGKKAGFKVEGTIDRFDYGLKWNRMLEAGGLVVGREIGITCNVELNEVQAAGE